MTLREEVLDSLADCPRTLGLIESLFKYLGLSYQRDQIIETVYELLHERSIFPCYAENLSSVQYSDVNEKTIEIIWFDLTDKVRTEQQSIEFDPPAEND